MTVECGYASHFPHAVLLTVCQYLWQQWASCTREAITGMISPKASFRGPVPFQERALCISGKMLPGGSFNTGLVISTTPCPEVM